MMGWIRCNNCYATGYVVKPIYNNETITGRLTNKKCKKCTGGYIAAEESN